jgi:3-oxoacyl-[acyl-carrier protein] reductase
MTGTLAGKAALVTGGSRGIGAASALALAEQGADVVITYAANKDAADRTVATLVERGVRAFAIKADQSDTDEITSAVVQARDKLGALDILVANAGVFASATVDADDVQALDRMRVVNVEGVIATIRAASKLMRDDGRIIAMSSSAATRVGGSGVADYASSKAAVEGYIKGVARDLASRRITVNALGIGPVETDMNPNSGPAAERRASGTALGRYAQPHEIGAVVAFVASPNASYITGAVIPVDGGAGA